MPVLLRFLFRIVRHPSEHCSLATAVESNTEAYADVAVTGGIVAAQLNAGLSRRRSRTHPVTRSEP